MSTIVPVVSMFKQLHKVDNSTITRSLVFNCEDEDVAKTLIKELRDSSVDAIQSIINANFKDTECDLRIDDFNSDTRASVTYDSPDVHTHEEWEIANMANIISNGHSITVFGMNDIHKVVEDYTHK